MKLVVEVYLLEWNAGGANCRESYISFFTIFEFRNEILHASDKYMTLTFTTHLFISFLECEFTIWYDCFPFRDLFFVI